MLSDLAIWYLRKRKKSVLIGYIVRGGTVQTKYRRGNVYDNVFHACTYLDYDDNELIVPTNAKFKIKS